MPKCTSNDTHGRSLTILCKKSSCNVWTGKSSVFTHNMDYNADMFGLLCEFPMSTLWENSPLLEWERIHEFTSPILNNFNKNCGFFSQWHFHVQILDPVMWYVGICTTCSFLNQKHLNVFLNNEIMLWRLETFFLCLNPTELAEGIHVLIAVKY